MIDPDRKVTLLPSALWRALDAEAEIWACETEISAWIARMSTDPRTREKLHGIVRLCFEEGFYRGALATINGRSLADSIADAASGTDAAPADETLGSAEGEGPTRQGDAHEDPDHA